MKKASFVLLLIVASIFTILSCSKSSGGSNNTLDCTNVSKSYINDVDPIVQTHCSQAGCHAPGSVNGPGAITNYTQVFNARAQIRVQIAAGLMPQNAVLNTTQKNSFLCWIDSGAPNN